MKKADVKIGQAYLVKVSGNIVPVRIDRESRYGGWDGTSQVSGRHIRIKTAAKLRGPYNPPWPTTPAQAVPEIPAAPAPEPEPDPILLPDGLPSLTTKAFAREMGTEPVLDKHVQDTTGFTDDDFVKALNQTWNAISMDYVSAAGGHCSGSAAREGTADYLSQYGGKTEAEGKKISKAFMVLSRAKQDKLLKTALPFNRYEM